MDDIKIGLDFGTHQTKICIQRTPDEGHGIPEYEFFKFTDNNGEEQFFLPSVVQINKDNTLSYGYVDSKLEKEGLPLPMLEKIDAVDASHIDVEAENLFAKYSVNTNVSEEGLDALVKMLKCKYEIDDQLYRKRATEAQQKYDMEMAEYNKARNLFRYFKQATLAEYPWEKAIDPKLLCIWYLAYILFLLEDIFPDGFAINMGVPTDDKTFNQKRELGTQLLFSAIHLVEDVYVRDLRRYLNEKVESLMKNTVIPDFNEDDKEFFRINIFPEAYASLIGLTSRGKLSEGMSLNADIGGGTTDISFFIVKDRIPKIYKYWSIPLGLNYIAEKSGFDYSKKDFIKNANPDIIGKFNRKKEDVVYLLVDNLSSIVTSRGIFKSHLLNALRDRILVYNGGGSSYPEISNSIYLFTDVKVANAELWSEEIIKNKKKVSKLFNLLTTAYGLSVSENDSDVILCDFDTIISNKNNSNSERNEIDKDVC